MTSQPKLLRPCRGSSVTRFVRSALVTATVQLPFVIASVHAADLPAFPGAEGYGADTAGGRGGPVLRVVNLQDSGPGSLRAALNTPGPRIVVFAVGGRVHLTFPLVVGQPQLTILGQTAPGGIEVTGSCLRLRTHDVIIRGMRFRAGDDARGGDPGDRDSLNFLGGDWPLANSGDGLDRSPHNIIIDHCSFAWSVDECVGTWAPMGKPRIENITLSWCLFTEPLNASIHHKSSHAANLLIGDNVGPVTIHHSLLATGSFRHPAFKGGAKLEFTNNLIYNWGEQGAVSFYDGVRTPGLATFIGNKYVPGPITAPDTTMKFHQGRIYLLDNLGPRRTRDDQPQTDILDVGKGQIVDKPPIPLKTQTTQSAAVAAQLVTAKAGALWPQRDSVDARAIRHLQSGTGKLLDSVEEAGGWPRLPPSPAPMDGDADGLPDAWEKTHNLDPANPIDSKAIAPSGYAWIEEWANSLTQQDGPPTVSAGDALQVSLPGHVSLQGFVHSSNGNSEPPKTQWTGPREVIFKESTSAQTTASFTAPGTYVLTLTGTQHGQAASDELTVTVNPTGTPINQPPTVYAGPKNSDKENPQKLVWPIQSVKLNPKVRDDGLPKDPGRLTYRWELVDNAPRGGGGKFDDPLREDATLLVSEPGRYVCKLSVSDGQFVRSSTTTVEIAPPAGQAQPVVFLESPARDAIVQGNEELRLVASASSSEKIALVEFYADGVIIGTCRNAPYALSWPNPPQGGHRITARAVDAKGLAKTSPFVSIWVLERSPATFPHTSQNP